MDAALLKARTLSIAGAIREHGARRIAIYTPDPERLIAHEGFAGEFEENAGVDGFGHRQRLYRFGDLEIWRLGDFEI